MEPKARWQLLGTLSSVALLVAVFAVHAARPQNPGQLKVSVAELRSAASESALLTMAAPTDDATRSYRQVHFEMLEESAAQALKTLESAHVQSGLEARRDSAVVLGHALLGEMAAWGTAGRAALRRPAFLRISGGLQALEEELE